ncbi:MAG: permease-like cell division protein FtsX [Patescibacteria group bacterium]|nr:permease-like cell division protein FtsX [Patescibacteria group bacterium]
MMLTNLRRVMRSGLINFWRMPVVASASVIAITAALFVVGSLLLAQAFFAGAVVDLQERVDVSVFMAPEAAEEDVLELKRSLELLPEVKSADYSSREDELADFQESNQDNELLAQSLREIGNPFGARLNIKAVDPAHYSSIAGFLESDSALSASGQALIDRVSYKKDVVDSLIRLIESSTKIGWALVIIFIFLSVIVTFNTISLAIYISREEISLMKLVGGSNFYVRGPFLVEGMISGIIASFIAVLLLYPSVIWVRNQTADVYGGIDLMTYFLDNFGTIFLTLLVAGAALGIVSSFLAVRRHLKA